MDKQRGGDEDEGRWGEVLYIVDKNFCIVCKAFLKAIYLW